MRFVTQFCLVSSSNTIYFDFFVVLICCSTC